MALLIGPGTRVFDATGNLISGGKIRIYEVNTTTLASIYSNAGLSSALANPCVANSAGWPADGVTPVQIFAASGSYDVAFLDASNNVLATFEDVPTVGNDSAEFDRTVSGDGRIKITGSAGSVLIQTGSPSPDNTGGALVIEGWSGTQLDTLELDAASANFSGSLDVDGTLTAGGGKSIPMTLNSGAHSASANLNITIPAGYRSLTVDVSEIVMSSTTTLYTKVSIDNGSTYLATGYVNGYGQFLNNGTTGGGGSATTTLGFFAVNNLSSSAGASTSGTIDIDTPTSGTGRTRLRGRLDETGNMNLTTVESNAGARITNLRIYSADGANWTCRWRLRSRPD